MKVDRHFAYITTADFLVRSAYQMGKTPLLPIFAASLGATDAYLGIIVSVSTLTGMILKPAVGVLSDRWGRRNWLFVGTLFFIIMPFFYRFVGTPQQLFQIRIVHGLATAIYGPVTLAYVVEQGTNRFAERLGWFGMARSAGYVVGPAAAGWLLLTMSPVNLFTIIGLLSSAALIPVLLLPEPLEREKPADSIRDQLRHALRSSSRSPAIWFSGGLESVAYIALYAIKAFLPIYALAHGFAIPLVGTFFALQEAAHMALKPAGGRIGDRRGCSWAIGAGMVLLGAALPLLPLARTGTALLGLAAAMGAAEALVFPATTALVSKQINRKDLGAAMGVMGTFSNAGKVLGPVLGGLLIQRFDYANTLNLLGGTLLLAAAVVWGGSRFLPRMVRNPRTGSG